MLFEVPRVDAHTLQSFSVYTRLSEDAERPGTCTRLLKAHGVI